KVVEAEHQTNALQLQRQGFEQPGSGESVATMVSTALDVDLGVGEDGISLLDASSMTTVTTDGAVTPSGTATAAPQSKPENSSADKVQNLQDGQHQQNQNPKNQKKGSRGDYAFLHFPEVEPTVIAEMKE
ncbi:unnamed protein product, partial [Amoebophrya sp. A25]